MCINFFILTRQNEYSIDTYIILFKMMIISHQISSTLKASSMRKQSAYIICTSKSVNNKYTILYSTFNNKFVQLHNILLSMVKIINHKVRYYY